jgi:hypothetical protein
MRTLCLGLYVFIDAPLTEREPDKIVSAVQLSIVFNQTTNHKFFAADTDCSS